MTRLLLACLLALFCGSIAEAGSLRDLGERFPGYKLYLPTRHGAGSTPLIVVLHGCRQDAEGIARATRWTALAEARGAVVLYPNQPHRRNSMGCWNWFLQENQGAGAGEPAEIMAAIDAVLAIHAIDRGRVYVAGLSAGGAMAAILMSCYPDRFAAGAIHSGLAYGLVRGGTMALSLMASGPDIFSRATTACDPARFHGGVLVVHGLADKVVVPANADQVFRDFTAGRHAEIRSADMAAAGSLRGWHQTEAWVGDRLVGREILVEGMAHGWSGGDASLPYNDPAGPDATALQWAFFAPFGAGEEFAGPL